MICNWLKLNPSVTFFLGYIDPFGLFCGTALGIPCSFGIGDRINEEFTEPAKEALQSIECEAKCTADFITPGLEDLTERALKEGAKRVAEETAKMAVVAVAKRVNVVVTVLDAAVMANCFVKCQAVGGCKK